MKEQTVSIEEYEALLAKVSELETKLNEKESSTTQEGIWDDVNENSKKALKETGKILSCFMDASITAINETSKMIEDLTDEPEITKLDNIPKGLSNIFQKSIDIQIKALTKFTDSYQNREE